MYIGFMIGSESATRRKNRNSVSNRPEVMIDKVLCLCNTFMAAIPRLRSENRRRVGVVASNREEEQWGGITAGGRADHVQTEMRSLDDRPEFVGRQ
jgi:hypothetical protein